MGALDVLPFIPFGAMTRLRGGDDPDLDCTDLAERAGRRIAGEAGVPVYLYGAAARHPGWAALPAVRGKGFEALRARLEAGDADHHPDFGGPGLHPTAGATAVGAREVLIAFNVELAGADLDLARRIAAAVRERDGGLPAVRAMGVSLDRKGTVQVSMNLLDWRATPPARAYAAVAALAERHGVRVEASEVVGLAPAGAFGVTDPADLRLRGFSPDQFLEARLLQALTTSKETR
jgi:glutamate formiminotransferase